ncbi:MAG: DJ-1/PfpI family protein [Deltaproteobacteria bacterium]
MRDITTILFDDFETLDVFGPVEILGRLTGHFNIHFVSPTGGVVTSRQNVPVVTKTISEIPASGCSLLIPGGFGVVNLARDEHFLNDLKSLVQKAEYVLTVCTGSILLSRTGLLNGREATSNKRLFAWAVQQSPKVHWIKKARWVKDGNIYTSSGVSAGMDMTLGFIADLLGYDIAKQQSIEIEYDWKEDAGWDPFSKIY